MKWLKEMLYYAVPGKAETRFRLRLLCVACVVIMGLLLVLDVSLLFTPRVIALLAAALVVFGAARLFLR